VQWCAEPRLVHLGPLGELRVDGLIGGELRGSTGRSTMTATFRRAAGRREGWLEFAGLREEERFTEREGGEGWQPWPRGVTGKTSSGSFSRPAGEETEEGRGRSGELGLGASVDLRGQ
jgi:hypothetical protein